MSSFHNHKNPRIRQEFGERRPSDHTQVMRKQQSTVLIGMGQIWQYLTKLLMLLTTKRSMFEVIVQHSLVIVKIVSNSENLKENGFNKIGIRYLKKKMGEKLLL